MFRFGQVARKGGTPAGTAATPCGFWLAGFGLPRSRLGHLLLGVSEDGQVRHRPLLAKIGGHRYPALRTACPINLQLPALCALGHSRLGPLSCHAHSFAICLAVRLGAQAASTDTHLKQYDIFKQIQLLKQGIICFILV
uniref:Uncharacterized protein n=1 Tax=Fundulus heteroclitus TaxID=8078 RepID=A0A3Q2PRX5_FUNHE